jgi:hypothetical protein
MRTERSRVDSAGRLQHAGPLKLGEASVTEVNIGRCAETDPGVAVLVAPLTWVIVSRSVHAAGGPSTWYSADGGLVRCVVRSVDDV